MSAIKYAKNTAKKIPIIGAMLRWLYSTIFGRPIKFLDSERYWQERYSRGFNSGVGSYGNLANFKAEFINGFVKDRLINTVIEHGCGDGNQLGLARYKEYFGYDVSAEAIALCKTKFSGDTSKQFALAREYNGKTADLAMSLDVIYHLVEDAVFHKYMSRLFSSANYFVIIYSTNTDENYKEQALHVRHRIFTEWIASNNSNWELIDFVKSPWSDRSNIQIGDFYPDFFVFKKR